MTGKKIGKFRDRLYYRRRPVRKIVKKKSRFFWKISRVQNCRVDHKYRSSLLRRQSILIEIDKNITFSHKHSSIYRCHSVLTQTETYT